jgi:glucose-1-phosphate thymidylyltransferase
VSAAVLRDAVVMAAGEGTRLRPITERYTKAVLPIEGRPVIATLLRQLTAAGIERVLVVTGHLAGQVEALVGDGLAFGVRIDFVRQPEPAGSADAVARAVGSGAPAPFLVTAADTLYTPGDVGRFASAFRESGAAGAIAVRRDPAPRPPHRPAVRLRDGLVERVLDDDPGNPLAGAPLWVVGDEIVAFLCQDAAPHELGNAFQRAIDEGARVAGVEIGPTRDLTYAVDVVRANFPYLGSV